jgi:hypothetical protein
MRWLRRITPAWITSDLSYRELRAMQRYYGLGWVYAWLPGWVAKRRIAYIELVIARLSQ